MGGNIGRKLLSNGEPGRIFDLFTFLVCFLLGITLGNVLHNKSQLELINQNVKSLLSEESNRKPAEFLDCRKQ